MSKKKNLHTSYKPNISNHYYREFIFWIGVLATIAYRIIIILNHANNPLWSDIAWYVGTIGFFWYFAHRYNVEKHRIEAIKKSNLIMKVEKAEYFSRQDKEVMLYTLRSLTSSKSQWNYIIIFVASGFALLWDLFERINWIINH